MTSVMPGLLEAPVHAAGYSPFPLLRLEIITNKRIVILTTMTQVTAIMIQAVVVMQTLVSFSMPCKPETRNQKTHT